MDKIKFILDRLEIDNSIFFQLGIYVVLFYFLKYAIFNKLKEIVVMREGNTTSLDHNANKRLQEVVNLENDYKEETFKIYKQGQDHFSEQRAIHNSELQKSLKETAVMFEKNFEIEKENIAKERNLVEKKMVSETAKLSSELINQLT